MRRAAIAAGIIASVAVTACGTTDAPVPDSTAMTPVAEGAMSAGANTPDGEMQAVLDELAALDGADPLIWCGGGEEVLELRLSELLPHAFRKANLQG